MIIRKDIQQNCDNPIRLNKTPNRYTRWILIIAGTFFVGLAVLGILLPLLPTTPFLLLAAACYSRSSKRFYNWLLGNKWFGKYIKNYREGKGVPMNAKILSASVLWLTILFSTIFATDNLFVRIILILIATGVSTHIFFIRTLKETEKVL